MQPDDDKTQAVTVLSKGTVINHYLIIEKIGAGGMGEVYLAEDTSLNRKVALKFLSAHLCQDADCRARFQREAQAAAKLDHPNIVTVYEVGEFKGRPFFAMQHIEGRSLREYAHGQELTIPQILEIGIQIAEGLQAAHEKGVAHRDIKPANVLIDTHGRARILDFGLASVTGVDPLTKTGSTLGTIGYMSPEQVRGEQVDHRTDIFSLGVVLYELIAGRQPFKGDSNAATSRNILDIDPEPIARYKSGASVELQRVITKALAKDRKLRYQHADELAADLRQGLSPGDSPQTTQPRRTKLVVIAVAVLLLAVVAVVFKPWQYLDRSSGQPAVETNRVVIVPFRNQTGDPSLDPLGKMVADWTSQSLLSTGLAEVVPPEATFGLDSDKGARTFADATGANLIISGSFYRVGDSIQFQAQVSNAEEKLLQAIEPLCVSNSKVMDGVEAVRQRVLGTLAVLLDERLLGTTSQIASPPMYVAYQEFIQGRVHNTQSDWDGALDHYMKAYALDTLFLESLLGACAASCNSAKWALADSLVQHLGLRRSRLTAFQQLRLDAFRGQLSGDLLKSLNAARQAAKLAPGSSFAYMRGLYASWLNRPRECIEALRTMDPERGWARDWMQYWFRLTFSYHLLGEHDQEFKVAEQAKKLYPDSQSPFYYEMRALVAMGKLQEVKRVLEQCAALSVSAGETPPNLLYATGMELRVHGYEDSAMEFLSLAIDWYKSRSTEQLKSKRFDYANTLWAARRWQESKNIFEELSMESPDNIDYRGMLGVLYARLGDQESALAVSEWLQNFKRPYLFGGSAYYRARIAAVLGDRDRALTLLRESFQLGDYHTWDDHISFDFESMRDYPPFKELMKPKG